MPTLNDQEFFGTPSTPPGGNAKGLSDAEFFGGGEASLTPATDEALAETMLEPKLPSEKEGGPGVSVPWWRSLAANKAAMKAMGVTPITVPEMASIITWGGEAERPPTESMSSWLGRHITWAGTPASQE